MNGVLTFQRADWPLMRRGQIPESLARQWRRHIIDTGRVAVDDLAEMAALSPRQMNDLRWIAAGQSDTVAEHRDLLLFWRSLPATTRGRLTKGRLFPRDLPQAVQPRAKALLAGALGTQAPLALGNARLGVERTDDTLMLAIRSPDRPPVTRRLDLRVRPDLVQRVKHEEEAREAALRKAAGVDAAARARHSHSHCVSPGIADPVLKRETRLPSIPRGG